MPVIDLPLVAGDHEALFPRLAQNSAINWYPHTLQTPGRSQQVLYPTPQLVDQTSWNPGTVTAVVNGMTIISDNGTLISECLAMLGGTLYRGTAGFAFTARGSTTSPATLKRVSIAQGGGYVAFCAAGEGFYLQIGNYGSANTLTKITDADFTANGNPTYVTFIDGYFVWSTQDNKIIVSSLNDPTAYDALDFASAEYEPDRIVAVFNHQNQLYVCGTNTIEVFNNIGGADFPFQRTGQFYDIGVLAPYSITKVGGDVYFIGSDSNIGPRVYRLSGNAMEPISNEWVEREIARFAGVTDFGTELHGWAYGLEGHVFYGIGSSFADASGDEFHDMVFDASENAWHRRSGITNYTLDATERRYQPRDFVYDSSVSSGIYGLVGETTYPLVKLDTSPTASGSVSTYREVTLPPLHNENKPFSVAYLELTTTPNPTVGRTVELLVARDGSQTFETISSDLVQSTDDDARLIWRRIGQFKRYAVFRFRVTNSSEPMPILKVQADVQA